MFYQIIDSEKAIKPNDFKNWCISKFESVVGEFPEIEKQKEEYDDKIVTKERSFIKKHKLFRYFIFPIVLILITIDEVYIRIKELIKKIDESE